MRRGWGQTYDYRKDKSTTPKEHEGVRTASSLKPAATIVAQRMREIRIARGMTMEQVGVSLGLDEGVAAVRISRYESGKHAPSLAVLQRLGQILDVPSGYFLTDDDEFARVLCALHIVPRSKLREVLAGCDISAI